jgi:hypothetical protein
MSEVLPEAAAESGEEGAFLRTLLLDSVPGRLGSFVRQPRPAVVLQLVALVVLTGAVGAGYLVAALHGFR